MNAISYSRFSPRPNSQECDSIERQQQDIKEWIKKKEWNLVSEHSDRAISGDDGDRPGLREAVKAAAKKGHCLVVRNLDRLARDIVMQELFIAYIQKRGGKVISLAGEGANGDDDPNAALVRQIFGAINEHRRKMICLLTHNGMRRNQAEGRLMTCKEKVPYGTAYDEKEKKLIPCADELENIRKMKEMYAAGMRGQKISVMMNAQGIKTRCGGKWFPSTVRNIMMRELTGNNKWKQRAHSMPVGLGVE